MFNNHYRTLKENKNLPYISVQNLCTVTKDLLENHPLTAGKDCGIYLEPEETEFDLGTFLLPLGHKPDSVAMIPLVTVANIYTPVLAFNCLSRAEAAGAPFRVLVAKQLKILGDLLWNFLRICHEEATPRAPLLSSTDRKLYSALTVTPEATSTIILDWYGRDFNRESVEESKSEITCCTPTMSIATEMYKLYTGEIIFPSFVDGNNMCTVLTEFFDYHIGMLQDCGTDYGSTFVKEVKNLYTTAARCHALTMDILGRTYLAAI